MSTLDRTQLLLEHEQNQALTEMARRTGRSKSELVRDMLRQRLAEEERAAQDAEFYEALEWFDQLRKRIEAKHGVITRDLVEEVRQEADSHLDRILGLGGKG